MHNNLLFFYVNVLVDADQNIAIENRSVELAEVTLLVKELVYDLPFARPERGIPGLWDKDLPRWIVMPVEKQMNRGFRDQTRRERYLLDLRKTALDVPDWVRKAEKLDLRAVEIDPE